MAKPKLKPKPNPNPTLAAPDRRRPSSVRHTRAIARDRMTRPGTLPPDEQIEQRLTDLVHPATLAQVALFHKQGLRQRTLTLPVMLALVLSALWRQIASVAELTRRIQTESLLWAAPVKVSSEALRQRLTSLPADLIAGVLTTLLPQLQQRWAARRRPLPEAIAWAQAHYPQVVICDGSTLDVVVRKLGLLRDRDTAPLAGRMTALLDAASRLPLQVWYTDDPQAHDQTFWPQILGAVQAGAFLIFDLGYTNFEHFAELTARQITFLTRAKTNLTYQVERVLEASASVHDTLIWIGHGADRQLVRLVEVLYRGLWYRYLTNERDAARLPARHVVALYGQRWRIEDAFAIIKRLLGLAYFWAGSVNAVQVQVWATWLLYAVLVDVTDAVADALAHPFASVSMEMVYRGLYYFTQAHHRGDADATDLVSYLAAHAKLLGLIKRTRKPPAAGPPAALPEEEDALDRFMHSLTCD